VQKVKNTSVQLMRMWCLLKSLELNFVNNQELNYFVAKRGHDQNTGTELAPFASLQKGLAVASELRKQGEKASINIHIQGGTYYLSQTIAIGNEIHDVSILGSKSSLCSPSKKTLKSISSEWFSFFLYLSSVIVLH